MKLIEEKTLPPSSTSPESFCPIDPPDDFIPVQPAPHTLNTLVSRWLLYRNPRCSGVSLLGRTILWGFLLAWGLVMITGPVDQGWSTFLHNINLPIHETGHLLFRPFGQFIYFLGGSVFQILLPAIFSVSFLIWKRDAFGAAVMLWWTGQNFLDVAPYINDARSMSATLVGGNTHDFNWLLGQMGRLSQDHQIASVVFTIGSIIMVVSLIWAALILWLQTSPANKHQNT